VRRKVFVLRLKFERTNQKLSQHAIALAARLPQPVVSQIENGWLTPTPAQLQRLSRALRVAPDDLLKDVAVLGSRP
jgi:transcriptional regulator with XRE-family HTH domain